MKLTEILYEDYDPVIDYYKSLNVHQIYYNNGYRARYGVDLPEKLTSLDYKLDLVNGIFDAGRTSLRTCENFPDEVNMNVTLPSTMDSIKCLEGITRKIRGSLNMGLMNHLTSLVGIADYFDFIEGMISLDWYNITEGGLGLVEIPKMQSTYEPMLGKPLPAPFKIINKYIGTGDVFSCQSELIDKGYEEYAKL